jgi:hypothetical protein
VWSLPHPGAMSRLSDRPGLCLCVCVGRARCCTSPCIDPHPLTGCIIYQDQGCFWHVSELCLVAASCAGTS